MKNVKWEFPRKKKKKVEFLWKNEDKSLQFEKSKNLVEMMPSNEKKEKKKKKRKSDCFISNACD